jgi:Flp pilus assembly pilin Flp
VNNLSPVHLPDPDLKPRVYSRRKARRATIGILATLIAAAMIGWLGFLGWGLVELFRSVANFIDTIWKTVA